MGMAPSWWVKGDTNGFASESARLLCRRHNEWSERSRAACARCRFVGRSYRGAYSGSVATSMSEAELDECGSYLPLVDRTARQHASDNSRRNRQRLKWRRRSGQDLMGRCSKYSRRSLPMINCASSSVGSGTTGKDPNPVPALFRQIDEYSLVPNEWSAAKSRDMSTSPLRSGRRRMLPNFTRIWVRRP
jgi:hypothetical protein